MELDHAAMQTAGLIDMPREITQMIIRLIPTEDFKNVACICRDIHNAAADILRDHQALIKKYQSFDIDVSWVHPWHHDVFGWDVVKSVPIIGLCTVLENASLGRYVRDITYTADTSPDRRAWWHARPREIIINHAGNLATKDCIVSLESRVRLLGSAKAEQSLSLNCVKLATGYTVFDELHGLQSRLGGDLMGFDISFECLEKEKCTYVSELFPPHNSSLE